MYYGSLTKHNRFGDYQEAYNGLYERGALPDNVPSTATNLHFFTGMDPSFIMIEFEFPLAERAAITRGFRKAENQEKKNIYLQMQTDKWDLNPDIESSFFYRKGQRHTFYIAIKNNRAWYFMK